MQLIAYADDAIIMVNGKATLIKTIEKFGKKVRGVRLTKVRQTI